MINYLGIIYAIIACACWGLSIVMPVFAPSFSAIEITLGRYLVYGAISLFLWVVLIARKKRLHSPKIWTRAFIFAITGNVLYYGLEVLGIQMIGPSLVALLFAANPIIVSLYGNYLGREFPYSILVIPIVLIAAGVLFVHLNDLQIDDSMTAQEFIFGAFITLTSISMWAWYAVHNARFLSTTNDVKVWEFNILIGVWCLLMAIIVSATLYYPMNLFNGEFDAVDLYWFLFAAISLGLFASFFGTFFWHKASSMLPVALAGQIIVAETTFGLLYTFLLEHRLPRSYEIFGFAMVVAGVILSTKRIELFRLNNLQQKA